MSLTKRKALWVLWILSTLLAGLGLLYVLTGNEDRSVFLPGPTSHGHHQIELACDACHTDAFGGGEVLQESCVGCHAAELKAADDSHPKSKFTDPRNADSIKELDATQCVTCHVEHRPEITSKMLLTRPVDYCISCHRDVVEDRQTHAGMDFQTCADAGCHNFHDNKALYEDFLLKHAHEPDMLEVMQVPELEMMEWYTAILQRPIESLSQADANYPESVDVNTSLMHDWESTAHAQTGVNCMDCHADTKGESTWIEKPDHAACETCHAPEVEGFLGGKHGMRLAQGLSPMTPAMARIPMHKDAAHRELTCNSCHQAHRFETKTAATEVCLECHNDEHSKNFKKSPHGQLWAKALSGEIQDGAGVSCASCHMPRIQVVDEYYMTRTVAVHNQNESLRPNEKMIRPVCLNCHGMQFAIDSLADPVLIQSNFNGHPERHVKSIDMTLQRLEEDQRRRNDLSNGE